MGPQQSSLFSLRSHILVARLSPHETASIDAYIDTLLEGQSMDTGFLNTEMDLDT